MIISICSIINNTFFSKNEPPANCDDFPAALLKLITELFTGGVWLQHHSLIIFWSTMLMTFIFAIAFLHVEMETKKKIKIKDELRSLQDLTFIRTINDDDDKFAQVLQVQEYLLDSFNASQVVGNASSVPAIDHPNSKQVKRDRKIRNRPPQRRFCKICLENKEEWQMFVNDSCLHTFCFGCTSKHIVAKIQDNVEMISCPGINCKATLDFDVCRLIIPLKAVVQWDELLCKSLILDSQKLYCPFHDCSTLLVDDSGKVIKKIECPLCKRLFCAHCRVPWHSEFTCQEFESLDGREGKKDELMVQLFAQKKNWKKCPACKMYVEKSQGCSHMTCRCKYEFCYQCGANWVECKAKCG